MTYGKMPIGIQLHTVRECFDADPADTLQKVRELGYSGVEFSHRVWNQDPVLLRELLEKNELDCYGAIAPWAALQPENLENTLDFCRKAGFRSIAIGSLEPYLTKDIDTLYWCIDYFRLLAKHLRPEGFTLGYHNHAADFRTMDGKTIWDHIFENAPKELNMVLDTGNAAAGGGDPLGIIKKYPGRQEWMHIKPYAKTNYFVDGYDTMIGEDDFDWSELIRASVEIGGCRVLTVEYGRRSRYQPIYAAYLCYTRLRRILEQMD